MRYRMHDVLCPRCLSSVQKDNLCSECQGTLLLNRRFYLIKKQNQNIAFTYEAFDIETKKHVIIKELSIKLLKKWKDEELFQREAKTLLALNHKQIPEFIAFFQVKNGKKISYYTAIELIDGETLFDHRLREYYTEKQAIQVLKEMAKILSYIHHFSPPLIHRDIKPENIIRRYKDGKLILIDFGSVTDALKPHGESTVAGTFGYMAPEQFMGKAVKASDFYALGVVLLFLLTKKKPEELMRGVELEWKHLNFSYDMKQLLLRLLHKNPEKRIQSYSELLEWIEKPWNSLTPQEESMAIENHLKEFREVALFLSENKEKLLESKLYLYNHKSMLAFWTTALIILVLNFYQGFEYSWLFAILLFFLSSLSKTETGGVESSFFRNYLETLKEKEFVYVELFFEQILPLLSLREDIDKLGVVNYEEVQKDQDVYLKVYKKLSDSLIKSKHLSRNLIEDYRMLLKEKYKHVFTLENIKKPIKEEK